MQIGPDLAKVATVDDAPSVLMDGYNHVGYRFLDSVLMYGGSG